MLYTANKFIWFVPEKCKCHLKPGMLNNLWREFFFEIYSL